MSESDTHRECGNCDFYLKEECPRGYKIDNELWRTQSACENFQPREDARTEPRGIRKKSGWTKHADWQPLPQAVSKSLPVCPICKQRTEWEVHDRYGWTTRGYRILCKSCGAEWEYTTSKPQDMLFGGALAAMSRVSKITHDNSVWILKKTGSGEKGSRFLEKEINFSTWKQMSGSFCGNCGNSLAEDEKFCPKCGAKRE